ncbi:MAG: hypothetical protein CMN30_22845 [Sandaracinus sp.]|nr:hypothetical protein [Sandaracinus sp.]
MNRSNLDELFDLDAEGPARALDDAAADALIEGALDAWAGPATAAPAATAGKSAALWAAAAAVLFVAGGAAAALIVGGPDEPPAPVAETSPEEPLAPRSFPAPVPIHPLPGEVEEEADAVEPRAPRRRERASASPDDLLREANTLRGARRWGDAERTYLEVTSAYPGTHAAYVAQVAAGGIRLERLGNAAGAARLYRAAIRAGGPLDPEARDGLARALRAQGDRVGERRALEALLERHPQSAYANRARQRLDALR